jgi:hypothetical protein
MFVVWRDGSNCAQLFSSCPPWTHPKGKIIKTNVRQPCFVQSLANSLVDAIRNRWRQFNETV